MIGRQKWLNVTNTVIFCPVKDTLPIYTVDEPEFHQLLDNLDPQYDLPYNKHFSKTTIPALYEETCEKILSGLKDMGFFCNK